MRTAIVVDYLNQYGGAEKTLEAILELYPEADVFTSFFDPKRIPEASLINRSRVETSLLGKLPLISSLSKQLIPLYPKVFESFDLSSYDLIISSGTLWAKGARTRPNQLHIFYCHTPPRFLYGYPSESRSRRSLFYRPLVVLLDHFLRIWDFRSAQRPNYIIANSENVRRRIEKFYRREATVIYPPVDVRRSKFEVQRGAEEEQTSNVERQTSDYFLIVSRLSAYKNLDLAIRAFNELKFKLKIAGTGREEKILRRLAGPTVELLGFVDEEGLHDLYRNCRAFIYTTLDEDFGITPLEANAFGKPVIALRSGGVTETMIEDQTAIFFDETNTAAFTAAIKRFENLPAGFWKEDFLRKNAERFSKERFKKEFSAYILKIGQNQGR